MSAFNNPYFPQNYNPYQQAMQQYQQAMAQNMPQNNVQAQNNGFFHVQNEAQAREYPVAPGNSMTFINDNEPYCYTKSAGLSQLEPPVFKRFRLVEEIDTPQSVQNAPKTPTESNSIDLSGYVSKAEFEPFCALVDEIKADIERLQKKPIRSKKEVVENE